jgi:hypothetical protein
MEYDRGGTDGLKDNDDARVNTPELEETILTTRVTRRDL